MTKPITEEGMHKIRVAAAKKGLFTNKQIAAAIGISPVTFSRKVRGKALFTLEEVKFFRDELRLSLNDIDDIFFA